MCSTLVSRIFCAVVVLWQLRKDRQPVVVKDYLKIRPDWSMIGRILGLGIPSGIENSMFQLGKLAIQSTVSTLGTAAIAAQAMTNILENLNGIAAIGVGVGLMTIVGQCLGAGRKDEAVYYIKKLCVIAEAVIIVSCLIVYILVRPVTILGGMESTSAEMCIHMITWITIVKPVVWTMAFVPGYGLRAAGDVKFSMITSCCTMWACRFCLCVFLIRVLGDAPDARPLEHVQGRVDVNDVSFAYGEKAEVLHNVTLHIPAGETVALAGREKLKTSTPPLQ